MSARHPNVLRRLPDRLLTAGAVLGGLLGVAVVACLVLDLRPVYLRSGSMSPALPTGSLVLARPVAVGAIAVGDVVCVRTASGSRVTHRVVAIEDGPVPLLRLQGDANQVPDAEAYPAQGALLVVAHVPRAGYALGLVATPTGLVALSAAVTLLLVLIVRGDPPPGGGGGAPPAGRGGARRAGRRGVVVGVGFVAVLLGPGQVLGARAAAWTDDVGGTGPTFTAATIPAPATFSCGGLGVLSVSFSWSAVSGATGYTLHYGAGGASTFATTSTSATLTAAISGGTAWVEANRAFAGTTWTSAPSVSRSYTVAVVSLCG